jgi:hypothetical protein
MTSRFPEGDFVPDQAPLAVQDVAFVDDRMSTVVWPRKAGELVNKILTVGAGEKPPPPPPQPATMPNNRNSRPRESVQISRCV